MTGVVQQAAARLIEASESGRPCLPIRDLIEPDDVAAAYAVQRLVTQKRRADGAGVVGRKIGLTSEAVQRQLGVDQPDFGALFDGTRYADGATIPFETVMQPRIEAEVGFVLAEDLTGGPFEVGHVRQATEYVVAALEVCGSRIDGWDISFADTVADNASAGAFVLGSTRSRLNDVDPRTVSMEMLADGVVVSNGTGADCLGDPIAAVAWLAGRLDEMGDPLRAGDVVLSGALGRMWPVKPGARVSAELSGLGSVSVAFGAGIA